MTSRDPTSGLNNGPPGRRGQARATPPIRTTARRPPDPRFSYTETPMEMLRPSNNERPTASPTTSTIEESPVSPGSPSRMLPSYSPREDQSPLPAEKGQLMQSPVDVHPAFFAPYTDETTTPGRQTYGDREPLAQKPHKREPEQPGKDALQGPVTLTSPGGTTSSPPIPAVQGPSYTPTIEPDHSFAAPPLQVVKTDAASHRPGQISHPNARSSHEWKHGLCDPSPVCCTALFCPCLVYGKSMYRLSRKTAKQDPTDLLGYESVNGACTVMALACGFQWALTWIQRMRVRKVYHIDGSAGGDCIKAFCCLCCVLAQDEREMKDREENLRRYEGPVGGAYVSPGGMAYAPPPK